VTGDNLEQLRYGALSGRLGPLSLMSAFEVKVALQITIPAPMKRGRK